MLLLMARPRAIRANIKVTITKTVNKGKLDFFFGGGWYAGCGWYVGWDGGGVCCGDGSP
jgi:hypothetical protein